MRDSLRELWAFLWDVDQDAILVGALLLVVGIGMSWAAIAVEYHEGVEVVALAGGAVLMFGLLFLGAVVDTARTAWPSIRRRANGDY